MQEVGAQAEVGQDSGCFLASFGRVCDLIVVKQCPQTPVRPRTRRCLRMPNKLNTNQVLLPSSSYEGTIVWWGGGGVLPEDVINASTVCLLRPPAPFEGAALSSLLRRPVNTHKPLVPPKRTIVLFYFIKSLLILAGRAAQHAPAGGCSVCRYPKFGLK